MNCVLFGAVVTLLRVGTNWPGMWLAKVELPQSAPEGPEALGSLSDGSALMHDAVGTLAYFRSSS